MTTTIAISIALAALIALAMLVLRQRRSRATWAAQLRALQAESAQDLRRAQEDRNNLLDALSDALLLIDAGSNIRFANTAAHDLCGGRNLINRPLREIFLDPHLATALMHCLATGEPIQSRVVHSQQTSPRGDQENRGINAWIVDAARLPATPDGEQLTRVILRDVTAAHHIEQIRQDFVANASHELRTPLAIINGYLENLLQDDMLEDPAMARHFLSIMRKHAERISRIVEDMLVISRLESGETGTLRIEPFPFHACIKDVLERLESVVRSQQAEIQIVMPDENIILHGDRFYWTQVLFNLIENALKQNPHHGLQVEIGCALASDKHHVWVADNGIGIPSADLPHIFRRFYRVAKHHSQREISGTGLGLSIVKRAVEAHHGTISVSSVPGRSTKFLIIVPIATDEMQGEH